VIRVELTEKPGVCQSCEALPSKYRIRSGPSNEKINSDVEYCSRCAEALERMLAHGGGSWLVQPVSGQFAD